MAIYNFLKGNSRLLVWVFLGVMAFLAYNQSQERKIDAQRIASLETTVTQMSNTVNQMAQTMQQTAELMQKFNQMANDWEKQKTGIESRTNAAKQANEDDLKKTDVGAVRIPDSVIKRLQESADAARTAASSAAVRADSSKPAD